MRIEHGKRRDFWGYLNSLRHLEQAFRAVGMNVDITLSLHRKGEKYLLIEKNKDYCPLLINNLTPEQIVKSAAGYLASGKSDIYYDFMRMVKHG